MQVLKVDMSGTVAVISAMDAIATLGFEHTVFLPVPASLRAPSDDERILDEPRLGRGLGHGLQA